MRIDFLRILRSETMRLIDADALEPDADYDDGEFWTHSIGQVHSERQGFVICKKTM